MKFKKSAEVDSSHYRINSKKKNKPVITIQGNNIILDFKGAILQGSNDKNSPDQYYGTAIQIKKGNNITIRNLKIQGYARAIEAKNIEGLKIENCEITDHFRRPPETFQTFRNELYSRVHIHSQLNNSIQLKDCRNFEITNCKARANENVLMLESCSGVLVVNNDFSFNSGAALILNSTNNSQVLYNRFNFNVADTLLPGSASIVLEGKSHSNLIYKNSITHSANGIMATDVPEKNATNDTRNIIMENDLSYSFQNGIYCEHSKAIINKNRIYQSVNGVRSVSPVDQVIGNNQFRYNQTAIDISGSGKATIHHNIFFEDVAALRIYTHENSKENKPGNRKALIVANSFNRNRLVFHLGSIDSLAEFTNIYQQYDTLYWPENAESKVNIPENEDLLVALSEDLVPVPKVNQNQNPFKGNGRFAGRHFLVTGKWGPYDFSYPLARVDGTDRDSLIKISVLGPEGEWSVGEIKGYEVVSISGKELPAIMIIRRIPEANPVLKLEFIPATGIRNKIVFGPF